MKRDYTQLPSLEELKQILASETTRIIPQGKEHLHFVNFDSITGLLKHLGLPTEFFRYDFDIERLTESDIQDIENFIAQVVNKILHSEKSVVKPLLDNIYEYLSEEDSSVPSDLAFVFGSASNFRIDKAIELYKNGLTKKIMISGKGPYYSESATSEADNLASYAVNNGVLESDIIKENKSITLPDNVKRSLNLLEENREKVASISLINSPFAQRRGWAHFKKFSNYKLIRINSEVSQKYQRNHWYEQEETIKVLINEFVKMKIALILNTV